MLVMLVVAENYSKNELHVSLLYLVLSRHPLGETELFQRRSQLQFWARTLPGLASPPSGQKYTHSLYIKTLFIHAQRQSLNPEQLESMAPPRRELL